MLQMIDSNDWYLAFSNNWTRNEPLVSFSDINCDNDRRINILSNLLFLKFKLMAMSVSESLPDVPHASEPNVNVLHGLLDCCKRRRFCKNLYFSISAQSLYLYRFISATHSLYK